MDGMVKVRSEYLREEAALLSEECEQALAQYQETVERFMALAIKFETKGTERLCIIAKEELDAMIQDINHTQVDTEEVLSDHAYLYERGLGKIQMAF